MFTFTTRAMVTPPNISRLPHPLGHILPWLCCLQALSPAGHAMVHFIYNNANKVFNFYKGLLTWTRERRTGVDAAGRSAVQRP